MTVYSLSGSFYLYSDIIRILSNPQIPLITLNSIILIYIQNSQKNKYVYIYYQYTKNMLFSIKNPNFVIKISLLFLKKVLE